MFDIEITNFQSIKSASFKFDGFTTIIGRNFIGKSATLRAINAALTNQQGTDFIRWGEKFCEVRIKTKDIDILWHKEDNNNFYKINDTDVYDKVGNQPPPKPVIDAGFGVLSLGKEKINLFYARQFSPLFLIDRLDAKSADLLISIYGLDKLYKAIDLCAKDQRENNNLLKLRKTDLDQADKDLEKFKYFDDIKKSFKNLENNKIALNKKKDLTDKLKAWFDRINSYSKDIKRLRVAKDIQMPPYDHIDKLVIDLKKAKEYLSSVITIKKNFLVLKDVKTITIPEDSSIIIKNKIEEVNKLKVLQIKYESITKLINKLKDIKSIDIPKVPDVNIDEVKNLNNTFRKTVALVTEIKSLKASINSSVTDLEKINGDLSSYEHCPACGSKL